MRLCQRVLRVGWRPATAPFVVGYGHLRNPRSRLYHPSQVGRGPPGNLSRPDRKDSVPQNPRSDRCRTDARPGVQWNIHRALESKNRPAAQELLGIRSRGFLRTQSLLQQLGRAGPTETGVQANGAGLPHCRNRGDPGRGVQSHGGGRRVGANALFSRDGQCDLLYAGGRQALLQGLHRDRQHRQRKPSSGTGPHPGRAALLDGRNARGRVPV